MEERVKPIRITFNSTGECYELDFSRDSVRFAEQREFNPQDIERYPASKIPEFWFYAFRKNHKKLSRQQTDKLLEELGGLTPEILERLGLLYAQAAQSNNIQEAEDLEKNGVATVEM